MDTTKTCRKVHALYEAVVSASFPRAETVWASSVKYRMASEPGLTYHEAEVQIRYENLCRAVGDFEKFLRDHRSQDIVCLDVEKQYRDECSACGAEWEIYDDDMTCVNCGAKIEDAQATPDTTPKEG